MFNKKLVRNLDTFTFVLVGVSIIHNIININTGISTVNILLLILTLIYYTIDELRTVNAVSLSNDIINICKSFILALVYLVLLIAIIQFKI